MTMSSGLDYRESHTATGKGKNYHKSFELYPYRKQVWQWEQKTLSSILSKKLKTESTLLDFACGTGRILSLLNQHSKNITGVDVSDSMLEVSKKNLPHLEIIKADLTKDNVFAGVRQFDVITAFRFFLNAQNSLRIEAINALHPLLKDDGYFIFNNHGNTGSLGTLLGKLLFSFKNLFRGKDNKYTYNMWSESEVKQLLDNAGFEIVTTYHRGVFPIHSETTSFDVTKIESLENWFSASPFFRRFARNIIYVCKKK